MSVKDIMRGDNRPLWRLRLDVDGGLFGRLGAENSMCTYSLSALHQGVEIPKYPPMGLASNFNGAFLYFTGP
jgi:hypothetical protein